MESEVVPVRLPGAEKKMLDELRTHFNKSSPIKEITNSDVLRHALKVLHKLELGPK